MYLWQGYNAVLMVNRSYQLRLFGICDFVIGELLYSVRPEFSSTPSRWSGIEVDRVRERKELSRILWANVATDTLDVVVTGAAVATGVFQSQRR
jgi:hypothetical protein